LYKIGDTIRYFYEAKDLKTGLNGVFVRIRRPDGLKATIAGLPELDNGLDPTQSGTYYYDLTVTHDGFWYLRFDCANPGYARPEGHKVEVNTARVEAIEKIDLITKVELNRWKFDIVNKKWIIYDDDGLTPFKIFDTKDQNGLPTAGCVYERVPN
jgi:hypothetical protein